LFICHEFFLYWGLEDLKLSICHEFFLYWGLEDLKLSICHEFFLYWGLEDLKILNLKSTDIREINIKLRISKVSNEVEIAMTWLVDDLNDLRTFRGLLYCNSIIDAMHQRFTHVYITSRMFRCFPLNYISFSARDLHQLTSGVISVCMKKKPHITQILLLIYFFFGISEVA
jgi:hypothetical protein